MAKNVIIVGGGFAGVALAKALESRMPTEWQIYLLSQENFITYSPLLPEVVGASLLPGHVLAPLRQMLNRTHMRMVKVTEIDVAHRRVHYLGREKGYLDYDQLIVACGVDANLEVVEGMGEHGLPLKTVGDALFLRNRIIARLEQATIEPDIDIRRWLMTFIVVGGGFSGVEVAGELFDFLRAAVKYYKNLTKGNCRVVLLQGIDRLLPEVSPRLGKYALDVMRKRGLDVHLNARADRVNERSVRLNSGEIIEGSTVICTIGTMPRSFTLSLPFPKVRGRIQVAADMSVPGYVGIWALGDCAVVPNGYDRQVSPPTAQFADRQAKQLAVNIAATVRSKATTPFFYRSIGQLVAIGHNKAVAELFGLRISGFIAWLLWRGTYLLKIPTLARKVRLFLEWNWAVFFPPDIAHLGFVRTPRMTHIDQEQDSGSSDPNRA